METERFEQAVREHQRMVFSLALHALGRRAVAEEVTQDVFLALLEHGDRITSDEHLVYWLRRVTARRCIDQLRRQRWRRWLPLSDLDEGAQVAVSVARRDPLLARRVERLIAALPATARVALVLRYQEDLDPDEIARVLGIAEKTVRQQLRHALAVLRKRLGATPAPVAQAHWEQP